MCGFCEVVAAEVVPLTTGRTVRPSELKRKGGPG
jgi:hypothetical protein